MPATRDLKQLARELHEFHAPTFTVVVDGKDLRRELELDVVSVSADLKLDAPGRFSFVVGNLFDLAQRTFGTALDRLRLGAEARISMGYRSVRAEDLVIAGLVTEVTTGFQSSGAPQVTVSGYDRSYPMQKRTVPQNWTKKRESDVVAAIARFHNLSTERIETTEPTYAKLELSQESDYAFVRRLAEHNDFEFYVVDKALHFGPPRVGRDETLTLRWGEGLVSFTPEINLADQVSAVEVHGWDPERKQEILGVAQRGGERGRKPGQMSGGELVELLCKESKLSVRRPLTRQAEVDRLARSLLERRARQFLKGSGECIGLPNLRIDQNVRIEGLGAPYSGDYYVEGVTHTLNASGYRTAFRVQEAAL